MFQAYMGNVCPVVAAVLVSATCTIELQGYELKLRDKYRSRIAEQLMSTGLTWAEQRSKLKEEVASPLAKRLFSPYESMAKDEFVRGVLPDICARARGDFMVLHRTTSVLRKCGQYQDLVQLCELGDHLSFTYCDKELYGEMARMPDQPLFNPSEDELNLRGRRFDFTYILDADTIVPPEAVLRMLEVAAAHPKVAAFQPAICIQVDGDDSLFAHLDAMRCRRMDNVTASLMAFLGQSGFYGKGMVRNRYVSGATPPCLPPQSLYHWRLSIVRSGRGPTPPPLPSAVIMSRSCWARAKVSSSWCLLMR